MSRICFVFMVMFFVSAARANSSPPEDVIYQQSQSARSIGIQMDSSEINPGVLDIASQSWIMASPNPCITQQQGFICNSTISWWNAYGNSHVYVVNPVNNNASLMSITAPSGSSSASWISEWPGHNFELRDSAGHVRARINNVYAKQPSLSPSVARGGSNYNWYRIGSDNKFIKYGIVAQYHLPGIRATVQSQLRTMYANGQRVIRYIVHFCRQCSGLETYLNSGVKTDQQGVHYLSRQAQVNLRKFLSDIKAAGFSRVHLSMGPGHYNDIRHHCNAWPASTFNSYVDENWNVIKEVRSIAVASGLPYMMDLSNEYMPNAFNSPQCQFEYGKRLWQRYTANYGKGDTVGISIIVTSRWDAYNRFKLMDQVYQGNPPNQIEIHNYGNSNANDPGGVDALRAANEIQRFVLPPAYFNLPWIIGETYYNDIYLASGLRNASLDVGNKIKYVIQWPLRRDDVNVVPLHFNNYIGSGF